MKAVIRIRGRIGIRKPVKDTFKMLRLDISNNCIILPDNNPIYDGMIKKVKDYVMYGPISEEILKELLTKRIKMKNKKEKVDSKIVEKTIKILKSGKLLKDVEEIMPVLKMHPARGGFKGISPTKRTVKQKGIIGLHDSMDNMIKKMW